jgi:predicted HicB family RNase H-like nuclease
MHIIGRMSEKTLIVRLSEDLHRAFKVKCAQEGKNMNAVLSAFIEDYVKEGKPKSKK